VDPGIKIAVLHVEVPTSALEDYLLEELTVLLVNQGGLGVVDRQDLDLVRREEQYQLSGEVSDETAQRIGQKLGAQTIVSGSFISQGKEYRLRVKAIEVETARIQGIYTANVREDALIRRLARPANTEASPGLGAGAEDWKNKRFYLGARGGFSTGFYADAGGLVDSTVYHSIRLSGKPSFDGAISAAVSIGSIFALQAEAVFTADSYELYSAKKSLMTVSYTSCMIPLEAKLVYRPSIFMVQTYAGAYLSLPVSQVQVNHSNGSYSADTSVVPGFIAGAGGGIKLGPGVFLGDIRYAADFSSLAIDHNGQRDISQRGKLSFSLGYEIGLMQK
jgi:hypothetical protein